MTESGFHRYVALGDSFTEGVGDPDPARPNGLRGWADRTAEQLATKTPDLGYANLAVRGRLLRPILAEQLEPAVALEPDLVTINAGANDILRPKVDIDGLMAKYDVAIGKLVATGARVLVWTGFDLGWAPVFGKLRGRVAIYNEHVREIADRHDATIVDFWRLSEYRDPRLWDIDRMHMSPAGHQRMAIEVLDTLGIEHDLVPVDLGERPLLSKKEQRDADLEWAKAYAMPWVQRRLKGTSSGDGIAAKRPTLEPISPQG
ncbi:SGNH/GDSL hydrolase family protein [Solicola gregarius]|uniref:SGNH/GDSL hydrolase family protein n=1 Tax=Solicola gregarius TaxID=2908642 RepID=A0AA46YIW7_9ACTN|nr:SGNH/GDSL hydrolase family protein [Solicola gregarius]UYM03675.1 SGNH/GDSL hydrolase family protein [Solicola gregarius]